MAQKPVRWSFAARADLLEAPASWNKRQVLTVVSI